MIKGSLIKRGKYWHVKYWYEGKQRWKTTKKTNRPDAEAEKKKILAPLNAADFAAAHIEAIKLLLKDESELRGSLTPLSELWDIFQIAPERLDCSTRTLSDYKQALDRFIKWCEESSKPITAISQVTTFTASEYCKARGKQTGNNTYNKDLGTLRLIWKSTALQTGWDINPWINIARKRFQVVSKRELSADEIQKLLAHSKGELRDLFMLGVYTGQRKIDMCLLKWQNVYLDKRLLWITPEKTALRYGSTVPVPIHDAIMPIFERKHGNQIYVLPETAHLYKHRIKTLNRSIAKVFDKAGIQRIAKEIPPTHKTRPVIAGYHSLRHSFVSICKANKVPDSVVGKLVNHSNAAMTRHYTHTGEEALIAAITGLPQFT